MSTWTTCIRIERTDGVVVGITELDVDIVIGAVTFVSASGYTPTNYSSTDKLNVNFADLEGILGILGVTRDEIRSGLYDFAALELFIWDYATRELVKNLAFGNWGENTLLDGKYVAEFRSLSQRLQQNTGDLYTPYCLATLGDSRCGVDVEALTVTGAITDVVSRLNVYDITRVETDGTWKAGKLTFTSGLNINRTFEVIDSYATGQLTFFLPLAFPAQIGDTYTLHRGCDGAKATCINIFDNITRFRGFPDIPGTIDVMRIGKQGYTEACGGSSSGVGSWNPSNYAGLVTEIVYWDDYQHVIVSDIDFSGLPLFSVGLWTVAFTTGLLTEVVGITARRVSGNPTQIRMSVPHGTIPPSIGDAFTLTAILDNTNTW